VHLMRRLGRLAYLRGMTPPLVAASARRFGPARRSRARAQREL
jgi:hypothetical protein